MDYNNLRKVLKGLADETKRQKNEEQAIRQQKNEQDKSLVLNSLSKDLGSVLQPFINELRLNSKMSADELSRVIAESIKVDVPAVDVESIKKAIFDAFSQVRVSAPSVNIPPIRIPEIKMPTEMDIKGWVRLMGVDLEHPLPVQLRDANGMPVDLSGIGRQSMGEGGGRANYLTIKGYSQSAFAELLNPDGRLKVELPTGSSGLTDAELRATAVPVSQVSGASYSVNVTNQVSAYITGAFTSTFAEIMNPDGRVKVELASGSSGLTNTELRASHLEVDQVSGANWSVVASLETTAALYNGDNRLRVSVETGGSGLTDAELRASHLDIDQVSGSAWSVNVINPSAQGDEATAMRVVVAGNSAVSVTASQIIPWETRQVSGAADSVNVIGPIAQGDEATAMRVVQAGNSVSSVSVVSPINQGDEATAIRVVMAGNSIASVSARPAAVGDSKTNDVLRVYQVSDSTVSTQSKFIARQTNPTAVADAAEVFGSSDDLGRQLTRMQARDLTLTAYVSIANGTETTFRAAVAGSYLDLIYVMGANNSDAAVSVDLRAVTGGNIMATIQIPANGTAGISLPIPLPQDATGNNWTADLPDITGTTVTLSGLFSREI